MRNREIYAKDPSQQRLENEGVAYVNDDASDRAQSVLRYELETFVCDGQYARGMQDILDTYLRNLSGGASQQPGVWISGFFGSGKSHLAKVLRNVWEDFTFDDGATARGITTLPQEIGDQLKELSTQGRRHGGLFAASGTLGASSRDKSVRLALLSVIFRAAGLPRQYPVARFVMWLRDEGILDEVRNDVEARGDDWQEELDNFYVAESLHEALVKAKPRTFSSVESCAETLSHLYPHVTDVSSDDMLEAIRQAISRDGKMPLTLVVLDEVQQYIGSDGQRSIEVQEAVEACCKELGSRLMFVATGQTAITGTSNLARLQGRFTTRIELSDADVDAVIRQVVLAKKPDAKGPVTEVMEENLGEISRHLADTSIAHRQEDTRHFAQDYPILPVRRRFWDAALRVLDQTGTDSQLRNQLSMIHKAIQTNLDAPLGNIIPADYLYFDAADRLLQARMLPRKLHDATLRWLEGSEDEHLMARACALVFLINKVAGTNTELGLKPTLSNIADLLVDDLTAGSSSLRGHLPTLLDQCEFIIKVGDQYRIQTEESAAWNDAFLSHKNTLGNATHQIETEREDLIRQHFAKQVGNLSLAHGEAKVPRPLSPVFDTVLPGDAPEKLYVWVRNGWSDDVSQLRADARQAGSESPTLFVFIPKRSADELRNQLIEYKAATATLETRGTPGTPEGQEAQAAMQTTRDTAQRRINELLDEAFSGAQVFQGGGNELVGATLREAILEGAENALTRLHPKFHQADHSNWDKVYAKAKQGAPDALKAVGHDGEPQAHPVCKAILGYLGNGKKGSEIREHFEHGEYGWPQDAVDGALQVLLVAGQIRTVDGTAPQDLDRRAIGRTEFRVEATTISASERIKIRKVMQKLGVQAKAGEESPKAPEFVEKLRSLADRAGGGAPLPPPPSTDALEAIRLSSGNDQLKAIVTNQDELLTAIDEWQAIADKIAQRQPAWATLMHLANYARGEQDAEPLLAQVDQIREHRSLLDDPDPIQPLLSNLTQYFRDALNTLRERYEAEHAAGMARLEADENWQQLSPEQRHDLLEPKRLTNAHAPKIALGSTDEVLETLERVRPEALADRIAALSSRFDEVLTAAAEAMEPQAQFVRLPRRTLKSEAEIDAWLEEARDQLQQALQAGPVITQ
ncbi:BREX system P-loop protein BrxC [Arhodomonas aquaeolei]|uniref:BREX system P-loop protein BrxC n=1 Tax=Arhodomonas aquaeolei TaxID=2369 RepID=UPI000360EA8D|nr:BREX system P-loop protein BrxC [Arhodomonas aquaeolei]